MHYHEQDFLKQRPLSRVKELDELKLQKSKELGKY